MAICLTEPSDRTPTEIALEFQDFPPSGDERKTRELDRDAILHLLLFGWVHSLEFDIRAVLAEG